MKHTKNSAAVTLGKLAGIVNKKKGRDYFSKIGKIGAKNRWKTHVDKSMESPIDAGD